MSRPIPCDNCGHVHRNTMNALACDCSEGGHRWFLLCPLCNPVLGPLDWLLNRNQHLVSPEERREIIREEAALLRARKDHERKKGARK